MIQKISGINSVNMHFGNDNKKLPESKNTERKKISPYTDSFLRNIKETSLGTLVITGAWSLIDNKLNHIPFKKALKTNLLTFFLPVTILTSLITTGIENSKKKN